MIAQQEQMSQSQDQAAPEGGEEEEGGL